LAPDTPKIELPRPASQNEGNFVVSQQSEHKSRAFDALPSMSSSLSQTAPGHLRTIAHLFGVDAPALANARVLEIGCASGSNMLPFAQAYPDAEIVGVDLCNAEVAAGNQTIDAIGLGNIRLFPKDIADIDAGMGQFDYVICHGLYSWVPEDVRQALLRVASERLKPQGVAYISYNVYPGWKAREIVRDAMLLRCGSLASVHDQIVDGRGMLDFLRTLAREGSVLKKVMDENIEVIRHGQDQYLTHEYLELGNRPCYFRDFMAASKAHNLSYLADAVPATMFASNYGHRAAEPLLRESGGNLEVLEQMLDFLNNRTFRQSLLVSGPRPGTVRQTLDPLRTARLHVAGKYTPQHELTDQWCSWRGSRALAPNAISRDVILALNEAWPSTVPVASLIDQAAFAHSTSRREAERAVLAFIDTLIVGNAIRYRLDPLTLGTAPDSKPLISSALRQLAAVGRMDSNPPTLFNLWHDPLVNLSMVERELLPILDGSRDLNALTVAIFERALRGDIQFIQDGERIDSPGGIASLAAEQTRLALAQLGERSVLLRPTEDGLI
jgi:SAM-dependent methyltransferase